MKRYIIFILVLSVIGTAISFILMYQHFFPNSDFAIAACGNGMENHCAVLSRSGYSAVFGLPVAGYGLIGYFILIITTSLAFASGDSWHLPCFAFQVPVAVASVLTDVVLGSILIYLKLSCRLCIATYVVNILMCILLFAWYLSIKERGEGLGSIYRNLISFALDPHNRPAVAGFFFSVLFMALFVFSLSAYLGVMGSVSELSAVEMRKFKERYYSIKQEDISLPDSAMSVGEATAMVRIIVFTDFLCPACMKFYEVEHYLMSRFPGKIRVDYYSFPLDTVCNSHIPKTVYSNSCIAAQVFSAAARRGIFGELLDYHYGHYRENLPRLQSGDVMAGFINYFRERSSNDEYKRFMQETFSEAARLSVHDNVEQGGGMRVRAVPTIFINGRRLEGVPEAKLLEHVISQEIKEQ